MGALPFGSVIPCAGALKTAWATEGTQPPGARSGMTQAPPGHGTPSASRQRPLAPHSLSFWQTEPRRLRSQGPAGVAGSAWPQRLQRPVCGSSACKHCGERTGFDRITELGSGAVRFDGVDVDGLQPRER